MHGYYSSFITDAALGVVCNCPKPVQFSNLYAILQVQIKPSLLFLRALCSINSTLQQVFEHFMHLLVLILLVSHPNVQPKQRWVEGDY